MSKTWIQSLNNSKLEPLALTVEMVGSIEEIAHSLAGNFRFTRQTWARYSVAQHCVEGSRLLSPAFAGAFLLHELSEVYLPDVAAPLKPSLRIYYDDGTILPWAELERQHTRVMLEALGLVSIEPLIYSPEIKRMDLAMLAAEKIALCGPEPEEWTALSGLTPPADYVLPGTLEPYHAAAAFVARFRELFNVG